MSEVICRNCGIYHEMSKSDGTPLGGSECERDCHEQQITNLQRERDELKKENDVLYGENKELKDRVDALRSTGSISQQVEVSIDMLTRRAESAEQQRDDLQAIVDKLPRTADGVVVVPNMRLFYIDPCDCVEEAGTRYAWHKLHTITGLPVYQNESQCYSTREAAEAAKNSESSQKGGEVQND